MDDKNILERLKNIWATQVNYMQPWAWNELDLCIRDLSEMLDEQQKENIKKEENLK